MNFVHCHTPIVGFITRIACIKIRKKGAKVIYTSHGFAFHTYSSKKSWLVYFTLENFASRFTDLIITINHEDFNNAKKMHCKNIKLINGVGINTEKYNLIGFDKDNYKRKIGIPIDKYIILSIGELSIRKNHEVIIKAISTLKDKNNYVYIICGKEVGGNLFSNKLKELAKELGVNLLLLGHRSDIPQIICCSNIGAIPSIREGLGMAGLESLAAGVPLVGSNVQGIKEYIVNGVTGFLYNPYDVKGFADGITKLIDTLSNGESTFKEECVKKAKLFDVSVSKKQMSEIYSEILH